MEWEVLATAFRIQSSMSSNSHETVMLWKPGEPAGLGGLAFSQLPSGRVQETRRASPLARGVQPETCPEEIREISACPGGREAPSMGRVGAGGAFEARPGNLLWYRRRWPSPNRRRVTAIA